MKLVVDANVLFAALIKQNATFLLFFEETIELYAPAFIFDELTVHKTELLDKTEQSSDEFDNALAILSKRIRVVPFSVFSAHAPAALKASPDPKDADYFALALSLGSDASIWSNDKRLKSQAAVQIISTPELIKIFYHTDPYTPSAQDAPR